MTINREAAELMALRFTNAVDAAHTFAEALRLATVALQEPREVPEVAPGTAGTATVRGVEGVRVMRSHRTGSVASAFWLSGAEVDGYLQHPANVVRDFVPDPDTAALRAEVERLHGALRAESDSHIAERGRLRDELKAQRDMINESAASIVPRDRASDGLVADAALLREQHDSEKARAAAAEARLAGACAAIAAQITSWQAENSERWAEVHTSVKVAIDAAQYVVVENLRDLLALVAADEQAVDGVAAKVPGYGRAAELIRFHLQGSEISASDRDELEAFADYLQFVAAPNPDAPAALPTREQIAHAIKAEADRQASDAGVTGAEWITLAGAELLADAVLALLTGTGRTELNV